MVDNAGLPASNRESALRAALVRWRAQEGLSQRGAAARLGVPPGSWATWELGVIPSPSTLADLATLIGVSPASLREITGPDRVRRPETAGGSGTTTLAAASLAADQSQTKVAAALRISVPTLSRWETREFRPHSLDLPRIATWYGALLSDVQSWFDSYPPRAADGVGRLRGLRHEWRRRGFTDARIAELLGHTLSRVNAWGTGRVGTPHAIWARVAEILRLDPERDRTRLLQRPESPSPTSPLAQRRHALGLTQDELGSRIGVSGTAIGSWETGRRRLPGSAARLLSRVLNCSASDLLPTDVVKPVSVDQLASWPAGDFGGLLRRLRRSHGLTLAQLSRVVGVTPGTVHRWEANRYRPTSRSLQRLGAAFDLRVGASRAWPYDDRSDANRDVALSLPEQLQMTA